MKHVLFLILMAPLLANAAGWTDIHGENARGEKVIFKHIENVTVQKQGDEEAYVQQVKANVIVIKGKTEKKFENQDCLHSYRPDGNAWLSCSPNGSSPLAGTTYHQAPSKRGVISDWTCEQGCGASSPRIMKQDPWE
jgi:hypothetical protein